jgi:molybdopterin-guanine dinucleotide biosynthesis protein A
MLETLQPVGVILGGGRGLRIGGSKLTVALRGRPLMDYPLAAMQEVLADVAVIAKADVVLPGMPGAMLWIEPDTPHNPLLGVVEALALAGGRPALVCPADIPFVTPALLAALAGVPDDGAPAVVASFRGTIRPLLGCYRYAAAAMLADAAHVAADAGHDDEFVRRAVAAIGPSLFEVADELELFDVDTPDDLLQAAAMLDARETFGRGRGQ